MQPVFDPEDHNISTQDRKSLHSSSQNTLHEVDLSKGSKQANHAEGNAKDFGGENKQGLGSDGVPRLNFRQIIENEKRQGMHGGIIYKYTPMNQKIKKQGSEDGENPNVTTLLSQKSERPDSHNSIQQQEALELDVIVAQVPIVEEVKNANQRLSARRLLNLSPVQTALSQT